MKRRPAGTCTVNRRDSETKYVGVSPHFRDTGTPENPRTWGVEESKVGENREFITLRSLLRRFLSLRRLTPSIQCSRSHGWNVPTTYLSLTSTTRDPDQG